MLRRIFVVLAAAANLLAGAALAADTGTLKVRFVYGGAAPQPAKIRPGGGPAIVDETLLVNGANRGIKNVVLYVYTGRGGVELPEMSPQNKVHTWTVQGMRLDPHVLLSQAGDSIELINKEAVGTNTNFNFFRNPAQNFTLAPNARRRIALNRAQPAAIPVEDNIFPWMRAYLVVLDHPFAAVSDEDGQLTIEGLPPGTLVFRIFHEAASHAVEVAIVNGEAQRLQRNNFTIPIHSGINDLGIVEIPVEAFKH